MANKFFAGEFTDTSLRLGLIPSSGENKRKQTVESSEAGVSLGLAFGSVARSSNSKQANSGTVYTVVTSGRDVQDESPINLNLDFDLHLGHHQVSKDVRCSSFIPTAPERKKLDIDLELSLSACAADSDVTSITLTSSPVQNSVEILAASGVAQLVDEGSTSSKWKRGPLIPPLQGVQNACIIPVLPSPGMSSGTVAQPVAVNLQRNQQRKAACGGTCQFPGCEKRARGASGRCISHGGGRRCQRADCLKGAEGKTAFCKAHGGGRRCEYLGCTKSAEGRTNYCIAHGGGRRCCCPEGCSRAARGKSGLCIRHGGGKRCKMENCTKSAEGLSGLCIAHGGGRRCQYPECKKGAQGSTKFCKAHGGGKRCRFLGCTRGAEGCTPFCKGHGGGKRCAFQGGGVCSKSVHGGTLFCVAHGGGKRCSVPECTKSARGRTNFCVRHGGGKRCKHEGCGKSAQGCTDLCKAHGGGKRCSWGQPGSVYGGDGTAVPCDKFARGRIGLCAAHSAQVQDLRVHGNGTVGLTLRETKTKKMKETAVIESTPHDQMMIASNEGSSAGWNASSFTGFQFLPSLMSTIAANDNFMSGPSTLSVQGSLSESRVHGGGLMAMLQGHVGSGSADAGQLVG
ncbi:hypothetical protein Dimus_000193 [Dionaea muscipula]